MYKKIEGIIINNYDFDESSKIIKVFTKDGIVSVLGKGAKKIKSPFFAVNNKISYGTFEIVFKEKGLSKLIDVNISNNYFNIKKDYLKFCYTEYVTELAIKTYNHENNNSIYLIYLSIIDKIENGLDLISLLNIFRLKMLDFLGITPVLDKCLICGSNDIITVSSYYGGFLCKKCLNGEEIVPIKVIKIIRMYYEVDINKIKKIDVSNETNNYISKFLDDYYDRYSGIYLKSKSILDMLDK